MLLAISDRIDYLIVILSLVPNGRKQTVNDFEIL
jgi:hypothetical protein